jgi:hypothetical protein
MTTYHGYSDDEVKFYSQFENPLEVVADAWIDRQIDLSDMSFAMDAVMDRQSDLLEEYPLISNAKDPAEPGLRRFMGVELTEFLGKIADEVIVHYPDDLGTDINILKRVAEEPDVENRRFIWTVGSFGCHLMPEREAMIRDTLAFNTVTQYRQDDPDMRGYYVEVTGRQWPGVNGNVYEVGNYADFARYINDKALPFHSVTLTYAKDYGENAGKSVTVSRREYDSDRHRLMSESGKVVEMRHHPDDERELAVLLQAERARRMNRPIGGLEAHIRQVQKHMESVRGEAAEVKEAERAKTPIAERLRAANEKVKAQKPVNNQNKTKNKELE